jgi:uncharacterized membrane protein
MTTAKINVNSVERMISTGLGGVLLLRSLSHLSLSGTLASAVLLARGISGHSYLYQVLGVNTANERRGVTGERIADIPEVQRSITIRKPAEELYRFWRDPQNLSKIMGRFVEVTKISDDRTHWQVRAPFGLHMEWETQIVEDRPGEVLRWESLGIAQMANEGEVRFRPAPKDWGTETTFRFRFEPPGGRAGSIAARRLGLVPRVLTEKALRRFKSLAETGELPTLEHNPSARVGAHVG